MKFQQGLDPSIQTHWNWIKQYPIREYNNCTPKIKHKKWLIKPRDKQPQLVEHSQSPLVLILWALGCIYLYPSSLVKLYCFACHQTLCWLVLVKVCLLPCIWFSYTFPVLCFGSGLFFQQVCFLAGLLSNCSIALFIISWNSLMNSSLSALQLTSDEISSFSDSSWSLSWSWGGSFTASCCCTFSVPLPDIPVSLCLSIDGCLRICSLIFSGSFSTYLSSVTASVTSLMLCASGVSWVSFLTVLTSLPNSLFSSPSSSASLVHDYPSCSCMWLYTWSYFVVCCHWLVYHQYRQHIPKYSLDLLLILHWHTF